MATQMDPPALLGEAPVWLECLAHLSIAAKAERPILVIGERGTGKELIGERAHFLSRRWEGPFVKVNCAALSDELLDSELFGHEMGAFTGARARHLGRFERAHQGTLFLDEIANASARLQEKILRVIEYGAFERVGGDRTIFVDVRVVAATNVDLPSLAAIGRFRADLLDRLAFDVITLPPLSARTGDIARLALHFGRRMAKELEVEFPGFSPQIMALFDNYSWPGNVRELKNVAERIVHRAAFSGETGPATLPPEGLDPFASAFRPPAHLHAKPVDPPLGAAGPGFAPSDMDVSRRQVRAEEGQRPQDLWRNLAQLTPTRPDLGAAFDKAMTDYERQWLDFALDHSDHHQGKAAQMLGLSYDQFRGLLRKHGWKRNAKAGNHVEAPD